VGEVGDRLREDHPAKVHAPLFADGGGQVIGDILSFSIQIVFAGNDVYPADSKSIIELCETLYRTLVIGKIDI